MIVRMLAKMVATEQSHVMMFKVVSQSVIPYVSKSLVVIGSMLKILEGFHHRAVRRITGMTATHGSGGEWGYTTVGEELGAAELQPIMDYVRRRQANKQKIWPATPFLNSESSWSGGQERSGG